MIAEEVASSVNKVAISAYINDMLIVSKWITVDAANLNSILHCSRNVYPKTVTANSMAKDLEAPVFTFTSSTALLNKKLGHKCFCPLTANREYSYLCAPVFVATLNTAAGEFCVMYSQFFLSSSWAHWWDYTPELANKTD